jgi:uncharacterized protein
VEKFKQFILEFNDLPIGITNYEFIVEDWFFENYEYWEIKKGKLKVELSLNKEERMYILHFIFDGYVTLICDRCADPYDQEIKGEDELIIKVGNNDFGDESNIVSLPEHNLNYDISQNIYENVSLLLPMKRIHPTDKKGNSKCDPEVLRLLDKLSNKENNPKINDPRWEGLNKLKFNK